MCLCGSRDAPRASRTQRLIQFQRQPCPLECETRARSADRGPGILRLWSESGVQQYLRTRPFYDHASLSGRAPGYHDFTAPRLISPALHTCFEYDLSARCDRVRSAITNRWFVRYRRGGHDIVRSHDIVPPPTTTHNPVKCYAPSAAVRAIRRFDRPHTAHLCRAVYRQ